MCGITGFVELRQRRSADENLRLARAMARRLRHRGPDDSGEWCDAAAGVAFGHRRLSILDLSSEGHQPMASADGRYVLGFNGEIYNWAAIRAELEQAGAAPKWRGHSDTEVMLAAFSHWGIRRSVESFVGMFAFAVWDRQERTLWLARDRLGEKPLYYALLDSTLLFASELKAFQAHPAWKQEVDRDVLALYMRHNYVPAPFCIYRRAFKLMPGTIASVHVEDARWPGEEPLAAEAYWSIREVAERSRHEVFTGSEKEATDELERLLRQAIRGQVLADVPVGAFLSGGIDSSAVVALMQAESTRPIRTFTIGFQEEGYDEAKHAAAVARHLGTDHTSLYITPQESLDVIPKLPEIYDEPFADSSQIPTYLVAQMARQHVTVSLSGDGGDEMFGGYNRYLWANRIWWWSSKLPRAGLRLFSGLLTGISPGAWNTAARKIGPLSPGMARQPNVGDKLHKMAAILAAASPKEVYLRLVSHWDGEHVVRGAIEPRTLLNDGRTLADIPNFTHQMMYWDAMTYLPDDILVKVDRAAMAVSLETRVPYLDHRVVEFAWGLPLQMKIRDGVSKWLLRQLLYRFVPQEIVERPKMGFGVPIDSWLRGSLRDWAESLLDERKLRQQGLLDPKPVRAKWAEHLSGRRNWQYHLWDVLMFQAWVEANSDVAPASEARPAIVGP